MSDPEACLQTHQQIKYVHFKISTKEQHNDVRIIDPISLGIKYYYTETHQASFSTDAVTHQVVGFKGEFHYQLVTYGQMGRTP